MVRALDALNAASLRLFSSRLMSCSRAVCSTWIDAVVSTMPAYLSAADMSSGAKSLLGKAAFHTACNLRPGQKEEKRQGSSTFN